MVETLEKSLGVPIFFFSRSSVNVNLVTVTGHSLLDFKYYYYAFFKPSALLLHPRQYACTNEHAVINPRSRSALCVNGRAVTNTSRKKQAKGVATKNNKKRRTSKNTTRSLTVARILTTAQRRDN